MDRLPLHVRPFDPRFAATVASWVRDDRELAWLSPETLPPMNTARILGWAGTGHRQFLFFAGDEAAPFGYGELNDMPERRDQLWVGHLLLSPAARGRALGVACVQALAARGFEQFAAERVILVVVPENAAAVRCYLRAGFVNCGEEWKQSPAGGAPYRLLRMTMDRTRYAQLRDMGQMIAGD